MESTKQTLENIAWSEYQNAARELAGKGLKGTTGDPLPANMTALAVQLIADDVEAFEREVRRNAYALAMERIDI